MPIERMRLWSELSATLKAGEPAALVTVLRSQGSSPREAGARMLVTRAGFRGTIGGGALEWRMLARAGALLADPPREMQVIDQVLGPDLGQCCGGRVRVLIEGFAAADVGHVRDLAVAEAAGVFATEARIGPFPRLDRRLVEPGPDGENLRYERSTGEVAEIWRPLMTPFLLFGAGHVGRALALALAPLPFAVTWVDARPEAFPSHLPANVTALVEQDPVEVLMPAADGTLVAVMTHSHALDFAIVAAALSDPRFPFVGLIGSATKRGHFIGRLEKARVDAARLTCPIGLPEIGGKEPAIIAASVAAQLLVVRTELARLERPFVPEAAHG